MPRRYSSTWKAFDQAAVTYNSGAGTFSYNPDTGQRVVKVGDTRQVATGDPASIFQNLPANAGGTTDIGTVLHSIVSNFNAGNTDPNALADLDTAIDRISTTRASVGPG